MDGAAWEADWWRWCCRSRQKGCEHLGFSVATKAAAHALQAGIESTTFGSLRHKSGKTCQQHHISGVGEHGIREQMRA
jgi:hypothetical protein